MRKGQAYNPFSTCHLGPRAVPYMFGDGTSLDGLLLWLEACGWTAQLVGPHGAGKSTLLHTLSRAAASRGRRVRRWRCPLPRGWFQKLQDTDVCFVDSAERLPRPVLHLLFAVCQVRGIGLVVTAHRPLGSTPVHPVQATAEQFEQLLDRLDSPLMSRLEVTSLLERHRGNARLALFELYDRFEDG